MSTWLHVVVRLVPVGLVFLILSSGGDPTVRLAHGYEIVAVSWQSPCVLNYQPWNDDRAYSDWNAMSSKMRDKAGKLSEVFVLHNDSTGEMIEFDSKADWQAERKARNASPPTFDADEISGITGFARRDELVIGEYDRGFFILDIAANAIDTFAAKGEWARSVEARGGMGTGSLFDPKSLIVQSRHPIMLGILGAYLAITLPWVTAPIWSKRWRQRRTRGGDLT